MTGPRVDLPSRALSPDEWDKQQAPGITRALAPDEWDQAQSMSPLALKTWKLPGIDKAMAPRDATATSMDNRTKGKKLAEFNIKDPTTYANPVLRQIVNPAMDNPLTTAGMALAPLAVPASAGLVIGAAMAGSMVHTIASYGWQKAAELQLSPEDRARAEADPERVSGESAAMQAAMLGLGPLIHVGVKSFRNLDVSAGMMDATGLHADGGQMGVTRQGYAEPASWEIPANPRALDARKNASFASVIEQRAANTRIPQDAPKPAGFADNTIPMKGGKASGKAPAGLEQTHPAGTPSKVDPVETLPAIERNYEAAGSEYQRQRLAQELADLSDAEKGVGRIARRPQGVKQNFFETEQGAQTLGAAAARHGMPEDANPFHPDQPQAAAWQEGHSAGSDVPSYPEGFSMGGDLRDNRIPGADEVPAVVRGVDGLQQSHPVEVPEGATPETIAMANALKPSRFRGHSVEELAGAALDAQKAIQDAQAAQVAARQRGLVGEAAQADLENRGVSYSDSAEASSKVADKQLEAAKSRLQQIEREFAMRGVTGDQIAEHVQAAQEMRAEREGMAQDEHLAGVTGDDPFAEKPAPSAGMPPVEGAGETRTRGLSAGVERKAIVNKLVSSLGDMPEYNQISIADQAMRAQDLLSSDPALARRVALGEEAAPAGLHPATVFVAVENRAIAEGDVATIRDLANSKMASTTTTAAQHLRILGERDPESPVGAIKKIEDMRSGGEVPKATEATIAKIRKQLQALDVQPEAWAKFIDSLRC